MLEIVLCYIVLKKRELSMMFLKSITGTGSGSSGE
jgi:hypothetical protein